MHVRTLEAFGCREVFEGTRLKIRVEKTPKGYQVAQVLEIGDAVFESYSRRGSGEVAVAGASPQPKTEGTVKWYDPQKGFGFIAPSNGDRDIFVHATALTRSGLSGLSDGQQVLVECGQGKKGLEVWSISLA